MQKTFNGLPSGLQDLYRLSDAESRSVCSENPTGEKGGGGRCPLADGVCGANARDLGVGWKVNPYSILKGGQTLTLASLDGPGCITHIWMTPTGTWRDLILRMYWDDEKTPAVECPVGDFFGQGWGTIVPYASLAVCVNPGSAFNCYWQMPFKKHCRITIENRNEAQCILFYQIDYVLTEIPADAAYFHAQFRRVNPLPYGQVYTVLDGVKGAGQYVGTAMSWGVHNNGWWGEGEFKFYLDGDGEFPTICGTGTEDYFCGSYNFEGLTYARKSVVMETQKSAAYQPFCTPYSGFSQVAADGCYASQKRFSLYRWHITDPIRFKQEIKVTVQALGWRSDRRYLPLQDDIASVAFWYQTLPTQPFPPLADRDYLEVI